MFAIVILIDYNNKERRGKKIKKNSSFLETQNNPK